MQLSVVLQLLQKRDQILLANVNRQRPTSTKSMRRDKKKIIYPKRGFITPPGEPV